MNGAYSYKKVTGKTMHIYNIKVSDGHEKGGWYRQLTNIESFVSNIGKRWYNKFYLQHLDCRVITRCEKDDEEGWLRINSYIDSENQYKVEYKYFDSVWDFYMYVGYDYKNKSRGHLDNLIMNWRD